MQLALGLIETKGLIGAIEAADAMAKAASVKIINKEKSTAALVTIKIEGEVAAVKSAVDAGAAAAQRVGQLLSAHVIPRPHSDIDFVVHNAKLVAASSTTQKKGRKPTPANKNKEESVTASEDEVKETYRDETPTSKQDPPKVELQEVKDKPEQESKISEEKSEDKAESFVPSSESESAKNEDISEESMDVKSHLERLREEAKSELNKEELKFDLDESEDSTEMPPMEELENLNVHELRKLARSIESFPIKGREISKANRRLLLDHFASL